MQREFDFIGPQDVLYIEDHPTNVHLMQALFKRRPQLRLVVAQDGQQARRIAPTLRPGLLLVDLRLPDCHGSELLDELRQLEGYAEVPAVAVTAEPAFRLEGSGFCEVWPKPLDLTYVLDRLDRFAATGPLFAHPERMPAAALQ
ncbi:MAG TPA: response regulator, partial [Rhizobacter sp.]